jgi:epoxyqueuosine reductase
VRLRGDLRARQEGDGSEMAKDLKAWAESRKWAVAWGPARVAEETRAELSERRRAEELDAVFADRWLARFDCPTATGGTAIVVAVPRPAHRLRFATPDGGVEAIVPPTYIDDREVVATVRRELAEFLGLSCDLLRPLRAPLKAVAVRLGLARYGRNNVTYVPGMGSYVQLVGALTDSVLGLPEGWQPQPYALLPECDSCEACGSACPTGAIGEGRILLHAERCLTNFNELPGDWPDWLVPAWHNCLLGCLYCQEACPQNLGCLAVEEADVVFDLEETSALLAGAAKRSSRVWERIGSTVAQLGLQEYEAVLGRNLRALVSGRP